jgi:hypothetical protein
MSTKMALKYEFVLSMNWKLGIFPAWDDFYASAVEIIDIIDGDYAIE